MASDSDDDRPLAVLSKPATAIAKSSASPRPRPRLSLAEESDDDDDQPLALRAQRKPAAKVGAQKPDVKAKQQPNKKPAHTSPTNGKKPAGGKAASLPAKNNSKKDSDKPVKPAKVFDLPGQTRDTPDETDPLRKFYTSLLEQRPDSDMARKWCVMHGLLSREEAEAWQAEVKSLKNGRTPLKVKREQPSPSLKRQSPAKSGASGRTAADEDDDFRKGQTKKPVVAAKPKAANGVVVKRVAKKEQFRFDDSDDDSEDDIPIMKRAKVAAK